MRRARLLVALLLAACAVATGAGASTWSAWTAATGSAAGAMSAIADWQAPIVDASAIGKSGGGSTGFVRQGGGYYFYAAVTDGGNPASGTSAVIAGAGAISAGATAVALSAGSYGAGGVTYNRRSALLSADAALGAGSYATTIGTSDVAANAAVVGGPSVTVDNTAPTGSAADIVNGGAAAALPDAGDRISFDWSEPLDPSSILGGSSGGATAVRVLITDGGASDTLTVRSTGGVALPMGSTVLDTDYTSNTATFDAAMTQSGGSIVVTLGTLVSGTVHATTHKAWLSWSTAAVTGASDRAGNALAGSTVTESGLFDLDF